MGRAQPGTPGPSPRAGQVVVFQPLLDRLCGAAEVASMCLLLQPQSRELVGVSIRHKHLNLYTIEVASFQDLADMEAAFLKSRRQQRHPDQSAKRVVAATQNLDDDSLLRPPKRRCRSKQTLGKAAERTGNNASGCQPEGVLESASGCQPEATWTQPWTLFRIGMRSWRLLQSMLLAAQTTCWKLKFCSWDLHVKISKR